MKNTVNEFIYLNESIANRFNIRKSICEMKYEILGMTQKEKAK